MRFLGMINFSAYAVPLARLHLRDLQRALQREYKSPRDLNRRVVLGIEARDELQF